MKAFNLLLGILLLPTLATALGRETGNAGHPTAISFQNRALEAIANVARQKERFPELTNVDLIKILDRVELIVVKEPIKVTKDGITQEVPLENSRNPDRIKIYDQGWNDIHDFRVQQKLALHELVSLAGVEETGVYKIERKYEQESLEPEELPTNAAVWKFRRATPEEKAKFKSAPPDVKGFTEPPTLRKISQAVYLPMTSGKADGYQVMEMKFEVLEYKSDDDDSEPFYQLVVTNPRGEIVNSSLTFDDYDFKLFGTLRTTGAPEVTVASFGGDKDGTAAMRLRSIDGKTDYYSTYPGFKIENIVDHVYLDHAWKALFLGKPGADRPYGLYSGYGSGSVPRLVKSFPKTIPGYEQSWAGKNGEPRRNVTDKILAVYRTMRGIFAVLNDMTGIISVNIETGESVYLYEVTDEGRFSAVLKVNARPSVPACKDLVIGIFKDGQGHAFYSGLSHGAPGYLMFPGTTEDEPTYVLHLGVQAGSHEVGVSLYGCRPKEAQEPLDDDED